MTKEYLTDSSLRVFVVPTDIFTVPDLSMAEQMVYMVLRSFCNGHGEPSAFPSYETIASMSRMSRRNAIRIMNQLLEKGLVQKEVRYTASKNRIVRQTSNLYKLQSPSNPVTPCHPPSDTMSPPPVTPCHPPSDTMSPRIKKTNRTKPKGTKSNKSVSGEHAIELDKLPRLTDQMDKLHFGMELKKQLATLAVELGLTDQQAVNALQMTAESAQEGKLHFWNYMSVVFKEKAEISKAGNEIRPVRNKNVIEDQLPVAIRKQKEQEAEEARLKAEGIEIEKPSAKSVYDYSTETASLMRQIESQRKSRNPHVDESQTNDKPF